MNYYLVHWTIRDGENEYDEYAVAELEKQWASHSALFRAIIEDDYFATKDKPLKQDPDNTDTYELPGDYRTVELEGVTEIPKEHAEVLKAYNMTFNYAD